MLRTVLLTGHVAAGVGALALGLPVLWRRTSRTLWQGRRRVETAYLLAVGVVCVTALGLVLINLTAFWWLGPIAALTGGAAYGAHRMHRRTGLAARSWSARLLGGTYVALVTALLVVSVGGWMSWVLPSVVGTGVVEYVVTVQRRLPARDACRKELGHAI